MKGVEIISVILIQWLVSFIKNKRKLGVEWEGKSKIYKDEMRKLEVGRQMDLPTIVLRLGLTTVLPDKYFDKIWLK